MKAKLQEHFDTKDPVIAAIVALVERYELNEPADRSVFQSLASSIASQQISTAVARIIIGRLTALHGGRFPTPAEMAASTPEQLRAVGFSFSKIAALHDLAAHYLDGRIPPDEELALLDDEIIIERCSAVRGIGRWTVQMLLMFQFSRPDVMPVDDFGVRQGFKLAYGLKGMPKPKALLKYADRWQPHRSAASWYLWRAIELHREGKLPKRVGRALRIEMEKPKSAAAKTVKAKTPAKKKAPARKKSGPREKKTKVAKKAAKTSRIRSKPSPRRRGTPTRRRAAQ